MCKSIGSGKDDYYRNIGKSIKHSAENAKECSMNHELHCCHRPIPPGVDRPPIIISGPDITMSGSFIEATRPSCYLVWFFGFCFGIAVRDIFSNFI